MFYCDLCDRKTEEAERRSVRIGKIVSIETMSARLCKPCYETLAADSKIKRWFGIVVR